MSEADDELLMRLHRESEASSEKVRAMLREQGREDLLADFDQKMRDIRTGVDGARGCWHALSGKQRFVLRHMAAGRYVAKSVSKPQNFHAYRNGTEALSGQPGVIRNVCRLPTMRNLSARELVHVDGGAMDPEAKFVITERGRFVLKHGQVAI